MIEHAIREFRTAVDDVGYRIAYAVADSFVEPGWWDALLPLLEQRIDYIGQPWWVRYLPGQQDMIRAQPWYRGVCENLPQNGFRKRTDPVLLRRQRGQRPTDSAGDVDAER